MKSIILSILILLSSYSSLIAQNVEANNVKSTLVTTLNQTGLKGDSILPPWNKINLTDRYMKPNYALSTHTNKSPWLVVGGGLIVGGGIVATTLTKNTKNDPPDCDFGLTFDLIPASCGINNGRATTMIDEVGNFTYQWSNGATTASIDNLFAGEYSLTVERDNVGCSSSFSASIEQNPAIHISEVLVTQPTCSTTANIQFTASSDSGGNLMMEITHPEGSELLAIEPGLISLVSYVSIVAGDYTITVWDTGAMGNCTDGFFVTINDVPVLEIALETVIPPSSPSANDGLITFVVLAAGSEPYTVFLDGVAITEATGITITIEGVGIGEHSVQISDSNGCLSNILDFFVPFTTFDLQLGAVFTASQFSSARQNRSREMPPQNSKNYTLRQGISLSVSYLLRNYKHNSRLSYFPNQSVLGGAIDQLPSFIRLDQMTNLIKANKKTIELSLNVGLSTDIFPDHVMFQTYWQTNVRIHKKVFRYLDIELSASLRGMRQVEAPMFHFALFGTI